MKKTWIRGVLALSCVLGSIASAEPAAAVSAHYVGYVCSVKYSPQNNATYGSTGYLEVSVKSEALCGGTNVRTFYVKSSGGSAAGYNFSEAARVGLMAELMQAARQATHVTVRADSVDSGVYDINFRSH